jgi:hypothetical protein
MKMPPEMRDDSLHSVKANLADELAQKKLAVE